ncbi:hypothetical protein AB0C24_29610 [Amycolatopsis japonica]|uniref:hypothetical protein n=1 Tax=Amycolatopsis japonica TaxID=208439 RepID=UPI0033C65793
MSFEPVEPERPAQQRDGSPKLQLSLCAIDRRAILVHIEIEEKHRRRGAGSVLVAAAAARGPRYQWTTLPIDRDPTSIAFWARTGAPGPAAPHPCTHQLEAQVVPAERCAEPGSLCAG